MVGMAPSLDRLGGRGAKRDATGEELVEQAKLELAAYLDECAAGLKVDLQRIVARERAEASHALTEQERRFAEERRASIESQIEVARDTLTDTVLTIQRQLEQRLAAWIEDIDRGQRTREAQVTELAQRQRELLASYDARLASDSEQLEAFTTRQRAQLATLREDLEKMAKEVAQAAESEIELHAAERRRALHEVGERLRARERAMREQIEREETETMQRLALALSDVERRQIESLGRSLDRATSRIVEEAERRFDEQIRKARENSAARLARELDKAMEQFAERAEKEVAERIAETARTTVERLQRQVNDFVRAAETQLEIASERVRVITGRLHEAIASTETRMVTQQQQIEAELSAKIVELQRLLRQ
jgi:hypothetical protein